MSENKSNLTNTPGAKPSAPPMAPKAPSPKPEKNKANKKLVKILIPVIAALLVIIAIIVAIVLSGGDKQQENPTTGTTLPKVVYATDKDGIAVTDDSGMAVTIVPQTTVVEVTNEKGKPVKDKDGNKLTTVIYQDVDVTVNVPVTDKVGIEVTEENGEVVTEQVVLPQNPNQQQGGALVMGTTAVPVTDGMGNTAVDNKGEVFTTIVELTSNPTPVAPASLDWKTSMGGTETDYFSSIATLDDGGYIASNVTNSKNGDFEEFAQLKLTTPYSVLVKYDSKGGVEWRKAVGSSKGLLVLTDVIATDDGGFYAVGYGKSVGGNRGKGYYDGVVYKFDKHGNEEWYKVFGTSTVDLFNAATLTSDGGIVVVGSVGNNNGDAAGFNKPKNQTAACVVKYDSDGTLLWKNILGGNKDSFTDVCESEEGNIYCVGNFASNELFKNIGKTDSGIVKLTKNGKYVSTFPIAGTGIENFSGISACNGGVIAVGRSNSADVIENSPDSLFIGNTGSRGGYDAYLVKITESMNISFIKPFRGQYDDNLVDIVEREDGSFIAVGSSNSSTRDFKGITTRGGDDIVIASFDRLGNLTWARSFGGTDNESASAVCLAKKGGYVVAGRTLSRNIDMKGIATYAKGKPVGVIAKFPE